jgi:hypothetical protein
VKATGAIVDFAAVPVPLVHKAGGRWNTAGVQTVSVQDGKYGSGPFALKYGRESAQGGPIEWRKVQIRPL